MQRQRTRDRPPGRPPAPCACPASSLQRPRPRPSEPAPADAALYPQSTGALVVATSIPNAWRSRAVPAPPAPARLLENRHRRAARPGPALLDGACAPRAARAHDGLGRRSLHCARRRRRSRCPQAPGDQTLFTLDCAPATPRACASARRRALRAASIAPAELLAHGGSIHLTGGTARPTPPSAPAHRWGMSDVLPQRPPTARGAGCGDLGDPSPPTPPRRRPPAAAPPTRFAAGGCAPSAAGLLAMP